MDYIQVYKWAKQFKVAPIYTWCNAELAHVEMGETRVLPALDDAALT